MARPDRNIIDDLLEDKLTEAERKLMLDWYERMRDFHGMHVGGTPYRDVAYGTEVPRNAGPYPSTVPETT